MEELNLAPKSHFWRARAGATPLRDGRLPADTLAVRDGISLPRAFPKGVGERGNRVSPRVVRSPSASLTLGSKGKSVDLVRERVVWKFFTPKNENAPSSSVRGYGHDGNSRECKGGDR